MAPRCWARRSPPAPRANLFVSSRSPRCRAGADLLRLARGIEVQDCRVDGGKVQIAAGVTADSVGKVKAGELVNFVAQQVGGKGGGKPDMAMAGGTDAAALPAALQSVQAWVAERA